MTGKKFKVANPRGRFCRQMTALASQAFKSGDSETGRQLYHRAAKLGCQTALSLDGLKAKRRRRRKRR